VEVVVELGGVDVVVNIICDPLRKGFNAVINIPFVIWMDDGGLLELPYIVSHLSETSEFFFAALTWYKVNMMSFLELLSKSF